MKRFLIVAALAISPVTVDAGPLDIFSEIFVFGDSLSDPGNLFNNLTGSPASPVPPLFPNGQITDGDAWATQVGADFASETNYAVGSARAAPRGPINFDLPNPLTPDPTDEITVPYDVPDFADQIAQFQAARDDGTISVGANPLAAVWIGGNDMRDALGSLDGNILAAVFFGNQELSDAVDALFSDGSTLDNALDAISSGLDLLEASPLSNIAVVGLPNFARVPEVLGIAGTLGPLRDTALDIAQAVSREFNQKLRAEVRSLSPGISGAYVDIFTLFEDIGTNPGAFDFTDVQTPCLFALQGGLAANCSEFLFYDSIHPTEKAHALVADRFTQTVAPVPLPAGGLLLIAGLGALLAMRRKAAAA